MILAAMIGYYLLAFGLIYGVAYLTYRQNARRSRALNDQLIARMQERFGNTPPLEPYVPEPLPESSPPPVLRIALTRQPKLDGARLPKVAAAMIRQISRLEESLGGDGLEYDSSGSVEEPGRLVLRLVPRSADWNAAGRLAAVAGELNRLMKRVEQNAIETGDANIRSQIDHELQLHLPPELSEYGGEASVSCSEG